MRVQLAPHQLAVVGNRIGVLHNLPGNVERIQLEPLDVLRASGLRNRSLEAMSSIPDVRADQAAAKATAVHRNPCLLHFLVVQGEAMQVENAEKHAIILGF